MKNHIFSSLNLLKNSSDGANVLLEYYERFGRRLFAARDFKTVLGVLYEELRKVYPDQEIEIILTQSQQPLAKFRYNEANNRVVPSGEFVERNSLYRYMLDRREAVLTNSYPGFCGKLGVSPGKIPARAWIGVPMKVRGRVLGALVIWDRRADYFFRLQDKQFLTSMTNMASFAIENIYLYDYIVEKNGSYKVFDNLLPKGATRNSIKNVLSQLLHSVLQQHDVKYTGLFVGQRHSRKWRVLDECSQDAAFSQTGNAIPSGLSRLDLSVFETDEPIFWRSGEEDIAPGAALAESLKTLPAGSGLLFPFVINNSYLGAWVIVRSRKNEPAHDEVQMYRFIFYVMSQLIEKKALMEQNRKYRAYTKHLEHMKVMGELASGTMHSLNNLLSVIIGKSQLLQKRLAHTPYSRDLELLLQAAQDGARRIHRLQSYSASGKAESGRKPLNINTVVQEVVEIARPRFEEEAQLRGIHYDLDLSLGEVKAVLGDQAALREVILNLINNALDAMPEGGKLTIQTSSKGNKARILVSDTGSGIPPEIQKKIFEPFFTTKGQKGNGLGLSIANDIVTRHNGKIEVDSVPGRGSIFTVELPMSGDAVLPQTPRPEFYQPLDYKVLLVEDRGEVRETLAEMLEEEGCEVVTAASASEALLKFQKYRCDVVLADLSMPNVNGLELARKLKGLDPAIPVFIITGWNQVDDALLNANGDIDGIIKKPFNIEEIRQEFIQVVGNKTRQFHKNGFSV